jgi:V/A-type H+-transporting ATPase subunit E
MPLETVVQAILDKGRAEAEDLLAQARAERERMLSEVRAEGAKALEEAEARAREAAERRRVQELARGELEARKIVLAAQKEALDLVYERALARLGAFEDNDAFLRALLKADEAEWKTGLVFANAKDEAAVKRIVGDRYAGRMEAVGGVVIEAADGTRRVDLRYESILRDVWDDSVKEVAEILWPSKR